TSTSAPTASHRSATLERAGFRAVFAIVAPTSREAGQTLLRDLDLDHVRRARDVHRGARCDHDAVALGDEPALAHGVERHLPQVLDVLRLLDAPRLHPPLERHVLERVLVVAEPEDRAARA